MKIYIDGSCLGNPGDGGWSVVIEGECVAYGYEEDTTNNRMELRAMISALEIINSNSLNLNKKISIYTDSLYVSNGINEWIHNWIKKNWKGVKNAELWRELHNLILSKNIEFNWIGRELNSTADRYAKLAAKHKINFLKEN